MTVAVVERSTQLLRGVLDMCLLAVVSADAAYGYDMTHRMAHYGLVTVSQGSIYPALGRLQRDGLVESFQVESDGGPPRKYYRPTTAGRRALSEWSQEWHAHSAAVTAVLAEAGV